MKLKSAIDLIINGNRNLNLQGLEPSATAFAVSNIATNHNRPTFIITPDSETGENIYNDLQFYLPNEKKDLLCQFPSPDTLPYTHLKTQDDIWSDRLKILYQLHIK
ncbi:hypothetical protein KKA47_02710, partial [bacterium]|nr:hypothetical protein [bacterium]